MFLALETVEDLRGARMQLEEDVWDALKQLYILVEKSFYYNELDRKNCCSSIFLMTSQMGNRYEFVSWR